MDLTRLHPHYHHEQPDDERRPRLYHDERLPYHYYEGNVPHSRADELKGRKFDRYREVGEVVPDARRSRSAAPRGRQHDDIAARTWAPRNHSTASSPNRHRHRRPRSEDPTSRRRYEHAIEKAIGAGSAATFRMRNSPGSWVGGKGLKVVGAASVAALIDYTLDQDPKKHAFRYIALSMV